MVHLTTQRKPLNGALSLGLWEPFHAAFDESAWDPFGMFHETAFGTTLPSVDISESDRELTIEADVPGYEPDKIDVEIDEESHSISISGQRNEEKEERNKKYFRRERRYGSFQRTFPLPTYADLSKIECSYKEGTLQIQIPKKKEERKIRKIEIKEK